MPYSSTGTQSFLMPKILTGGRLFSGSVIVRNLVIHVHPTMWYHVPVPPVNRTDLHVRPNERCAILEIFFLQGVTVSSVRRQKHCKLIKAIVDIRLCPRCALPSPPSRLIGSDFSRFLFALAWHTEWSILLHDVIGDWMILLQRTRQRRLQWRLPMLLNGLDNPQNCPFPLGFCHCARQGPSHSHRQHARKN